MGPGFFALNAVVIQQTTQVRLGLHDLSHAKVWIKMKSWVNHGMGR